MCTALSLIRPNRCISFHCGGVPLLLLLSVAVGTGRQADGLHLFSLMSRACGLLVLGCLLLISLDKVSPAQGLLNIPEWETFGLGAAASRPLSRRLSERLPVRLLVLIG